MLRDLRGHEETPDLLARMDQQAAMDLPGLPEIRGLQVIAGHRVSRDRLALPGSRVQPDRKATRATKGMKALRDRRQTRGERRVLHRLEPAIAPYSSLLTTGNTPSLSSNGQTIRPSSCPSTSPAFPQRVLVHIGLEDRAVLSGTPRLASLLSALVPPSMERPSTKLADLDQPASKASKGRRANKVRLVRKATRDRQVIEALPGQTGRMVPRALQVRRAIEVRQVIEALPGRMEWMGHRDPQATGDRQGKTAMQGLKVSKARKAPLDHKARRVTRAIKGIGGRKESREKQARKDQRE